MIVKRREPCAHLRPDYDRLERAHYIHKDPDTGEISWDPHTIEDDLVRLGLVVKNAYQPRDFCEAEDPDT